jgi:hypothetical protein
VKARGAGAPGSGEGEVAAPTWGDRERERDYEDDEDEKALRRLSRSGGGVSGPAGGGLYWGSSRYLAPNFTLLYGVVAALLVLLVGWKSQGRKK